MGTIPVIDLSEAVAGRDSSRAAGEIGTACREVGFFQVVGHGVDAALLATAYDTADDLFSRPREEKERWKDPLGHPFRGWWERRTRSGKVLVERFQVYGFDDAADARRAGVDERWLDYFAPNVWPDTVPELREAWRACLTSTRRLGATIMRLFAEALDLDPHHFDPMVRLDASSLAVNHYPGEAVDPSGQREVFGEHSDSGTLTILHQRGTYEGLQIRLLDGSIHTVPLIDEAFVINIGDLMARWTNDRWRSTRHRVVAGTEPTHRRASLTTFYTPAVDTVVEPLPSSIGDEGPLYVPVRQYDWEGQYLAAYRQRAATA
jgi:isopenicillin N synthase-like dioxygenase